MKHEESLNQILVLKWFKIQYPHLDGLLVGSPAGVNLGLIQRIRLKAMGLMPGFPDLQLLVPRPTKESHVSGGLTFYSTDWTHGLFIEMKSKGGKVSPVQKKYHDKLAVQNYTIVVCYSFEEAKDEIKKYLEK